MTSLQPLPSSIYSRERAAGYDPRRLRQARVLVVGVGAAGSNLIQTLALSGLGNIYAVDPDHIEPSNLTRSPLYIRDRLRGKRKRMKAKEAGLGLKTLGIPELPLYFFAADYIEALGLGAIADVDAVAGCVDSNEVRALLADWTRLTSTPYVEVGFRKEHFNVSVFANSAPEEPCWCCSHPELFHGSVSCSMYAAQAVSSGLVPAVQATAAASSAIASEAIIQALHGQFPLENRRLHLDIRTGRSDLVELVRDAECPGVHAIWPEPIPLSVVSSQALQVLFEALEAHLLDPVIELPFPYLHQMPCEKCGRPVRLKRPSWKMKYAPRCRVCPDEPQSNPSGPIIHTEITSNDPLKSAPCYQVGLASGAIFSARSSGLDQPIIFRLASKTEELYQELSMR